MYWSIFTDHSSSSSDAIAFPFLYIFFGAFLTCFIVSSSSETSTVFFATLGIVSLSYSESSSSPWISSSLLSSTETVSSYALLLASAAYYSYVSASASTSWSALEINLFPALFFFSGLEAFSDFYSFSVFELQTTTVE